MAVRVVMVCSVARRDAEGQQHLVLRSCRSGIPSAAAMLDRRLLYFLAVAREGSFSRAADVLHVAQPAVSRQVALLEAELGLRLLERGPAGVACTEAGALLAARGEELARAAGALRAELDGLRSGARGRVLLGYSTSLGYGAAPAVIAALR